MAKKNTSALAPAPIKLATTTSRTKPKTREIKVIALTMMPDLSKRLLTVTSNKESKPHYLIRKDKNVIVRSDKY
ncbi:Uncharacterised protein [Vibrio cholerae]|uniref:Uncharacterized protein n=1 Tax=Vibrio cholerae TaxID=666 RepID=A0A655Z525_VIBCL|nr:Uncharacterised protein [Vibrio cholerae]CSC58661.1 Uncharacterised protein [Vibrio cholerae]CSD16862.1 Uncharacterised protein [Vibrio cholerae]CSD40275.1 Uncharacterised protein [Vibrio cholerae]